MMSPIERAAVALSMADPDERGLPAGVEMAEFYRGLARAVLQAIREPSEGMMNAAAETPGMKACSNAMVLHQTRGYKLDATAFADGSPLQQAWRAAVDQMLSE